MSATPMMRWAAAAALLSLGALGACDEDAPVSPAADAGAETSDPDFVDTTCRDPGYTPGLCAPGVTEARPATRPGSHVALPEPIVYDEAPPASGPHRGAWARWGEYTWLAPQWWVHNLEHGGVAILYHPCAPEAVVDALRAWAKGRADDDGGPFRYVLTPYADLPATVAVTAWEQVYTAECVTAAELDAFAAAHYRKAPEDVASDGPHAVGWVGR